eukprot:3941002-Rhodomonas_salina.10
MIFHDDDMAWAQDQGQGGPASLQALNKRRGFPVAKTRQQNPTNTRTGVVALSVHHKRVGSPSEFHVLRAPPRCNDRSELMRLSKGARPRQPRRVDARTSARQQDMIASGNLNSFPGFIVLEKT